MKEENMETTTTNPFADDTQAEENQVAKAVLAKAKPAPTGDYKLDSAKPFPYVNVDGDIKIGVAVAIEENTSDALFGGDDNSEKGMFIFDAETELPIMTELSFSGETLSKKMKSIPTEVFENLLNVRKTVTLSKAYKNLMNTQINIASELSNLIHEDELKIVNREFKKNSDMSRDLISKINETAGDDLHGMLSAYQFKKHLLITGDAGQGKTYIVDKFIDDEGMTYVQENGHTGLEAIDLIGHMIKLDDGSFGWKDGSLSEAFRLAEAGEKVVYFIDEMLRIPARELNILVSSLTPNSRGQLKLRTNRPSSLSDHGIVKGEEITIPQENFWVVATTNQGAGYQSARIDEALKDRFRMFYQEMDDTEVHEIITHKLAVHGGTESLVKALVSLIEKTKEIQSTGNIPRSFTIRHLSEAVDTAVNLKGVKKKMIELVNNIVAIDSDGRFNKEQRNIVSALIKKTI